MTPKKNIRIPSGEDGGLGSYGMYIGRVVSPRFQGIQGFQGRGNG